MLEIDHWNPGNNVVLNMFYHLLKKNLFRNVSYGLMSHINCRMISLFLWAGNKRRLHWNDNLVSVEKFNSIFDRGIRRNDAMAMIMNWPIYEAVRGFFEIRIISQTATRLSTEAWSCSRKYEGRWSTNNTG